jgi:hypothetical protein
MSLHQAWGAVLVSACMLCVTLASLALHRPFTAQYDMDEVSLLHHRQITLSPHGSGGKLFGSLLS